MIVFQVGPSAGTLGHHQDQAQADNGLLITDKQKITITWLLGSARPSVWYWYWYEIWLTTQIMCRLRPCNSAGLRHGLAAAPPRASAVWRVANMYYWYQQCALPTPAADGLTSHCTALRSCCNMSHWRSWSFVHSSSKVRGSCSCISAVGVRYQLQSGCY